MGFFDWLRRDPKQPISAPTEPTSNQDATTTADRPDFTLSLPFRWVAVPSEAGYEFRNQNLPEQISVTVNHHTRTLATAELDEVVARLVNLRRNAIGQLSAGKAHFSDTETTRSNGQVEARVIGEDATNNVRLAFVIRGTPTKTITVALTRYTLGEVSTPFETYAGSIFDLLQIKNA